MITDIRGEDDDADDDAASEFSLLVKVESQEPLQATLNSHLSGLTLKKWHRNFPLKESTLPW